MKKRTKRKKTRRSRRRRSHRRRRRKRTRGRRVRYRGGGIKPKMSTWRAVRWKNRCPHYSQAVGIENKLCRAKAMAACGQISQCWMPPTYGKEGFWRDQCEWNGADCEGVMSSGPNIHYDWREREALRRATLEAEREASAAQHPHNPKNKGRRRRRGYPRAGPTTHAIELTPQPWWPKTVRERYYYGTF